MKQIVQLRPRILDSREQALVEFALLLPFLLLLVFGLVDISYLLLHQHVVTKLTREGSNLISRNTSLDDAVGALTAMSVRPVDFGTRSKVIVSVLKTGATTGTANYDRIFLYQRHEYGTLPDGSKLSTRGGGTFRGPPDYEAAGSDHAAGLQVTSVPASLIAARGGSDRRHRDLHEARLTDPARLLGH